MKPEDPSDSSSNNSSEDISGALANEKPDYSKPVAYDQQGRPLYAHPPATQASSQPFNQATAASDGAQDDRPGGKVDNLVGLVQQPQSQSQASSQAQHHYVHVTRPMAPNELEIPAHLRERHEKSRKMFPHLNLSEGEYIINAVKRHPIGLIEIWGGAFLLILALIAMLAAVVNGGDDRGTNEIAILGSVLIGFMAFMIMVGAAVAAYVYNKNRFYLTNESVIQEIQNSLFSKHEQTVSLANIEDASYRQNGILPHLLDYGTIRLSTEGDETTYRFSYVARPKQHIAILNNAVESFKNGRPVDPPGGDKFE